MTDFQSEQLDYDRSGDQTQINQGDLQYRAMTEIWKFQIVDISQLKIRTPLDYNSLELNGLSEI